ncbi:hypothetical protein H4Q26_009085 [Puccinia striiformis f. sp. tritici PST-130]|nr:hypothetical protein H4Q26_009085 [Puccinia striiformis f. sp. tritici PST-130]
MNDQRGPLTDEKCTIAYGKSSATMAVCIAEHQTYTCYGPVSGTARQVLPLISPAPGSNGNSSTPPQTPSGGSEAPPSSSGATTDNSKNLEQNQLVPRKVGPQQASRPLRQAGNDEILSILNLNPALPTPNGSSIQAYRSVLVAVLLTSGVFATEDVKECERYERANSTTASCNDVPGSVCTGGCTGYVTATNVPPAPKLMIKEPR